MTPEKNEALVIWIKALDDATDAALERLHATLAFRRAGLARRSGECTHSLRGHPDERLAGVPRISGEDALVTGVARRTGGVASVSEL